MGRRGDLESAGALLALTLPRLIANSLVIKSDSPGPVLERRERIGRHGRRFRMPTVRCPPSPCVVQAARDAAPSDLTYLGLLQVRNRAFALVLKVT